MKKKQKRKTLVQCVMAFILLLAQTGFGPQAADKDPQHVVWSLLVQRHLQPGARRHGGGSLCQQLPGRLRDHADGQGRSRCPVPLAITRDPKQTDSVLRSFRENVLISFLEAKADRTCGLFLHLATRSSSQSSYVSVSLNATNTFFRFISLKGPTFSVLYFPSQTPAEQLCMINYPH